MFFSRPDPRFTTHLALNLRIAIQAVLDNKLRSLLTALGIVFGVAAVIAMLGIGEGAREEISNQIEAAGINNIVINPIIPEAKGGDEGATQNMKKQFSPGLSINDTDGIKEIIPGVKKISPEVITNADIFYNGRKGPAKLAGVLPAHFEIHNLLVSEGSMFTAEQIENASSVCIISRSVESQFLPTENPVGKYVKVGLHWLNIVGVVEQNIFTKEAGNEENLVTSDIQIYCPLQTMLIRYENRKLVKESDLVRAAIRNKGIALSGNVENPERDGQKNYHQLDRLVIQVSESIKLEATAQIISRLLVRKHAGLSDFEIQIPQLLLKQQQRSNEIFNYVLGAIAGISLLVGGIGIMNIMLASVLERIKEIGIRLTVGARISDIAAQFLLEAVIICVAAGTVGVFLGIILTLFITKIADIPTVISMQSIMIAFSVAAITGLVFGVIPALKASEKTPVSSLRNE